MSGRMRRIQLHLARAFRARPPVPPGRARRLQVVLSAVIAMVLVVALVAVRTSIDTDPLSKRTSRVVVKAVPDSKSKAQRHATDSTDTSLDDEVSDEDPCFVNPVDPSCSDPNSPNYDSTLDPNSPDYDPCYVNEDDPSCNDSDFDGGDDGYDPSFDDPCYDDPDDPSCYDPDFDDSDDSDDSSFDDPCYDNPDDPSCSDPDYEDPDDPEFDDPCYDNPDDPSCNEPDPDPEEPDPTTVPPPTTPPTTVPGQPGPDAEFDEFALNHTIEGLFLSGHVEGTCTAPVTFTVTSASGNYTNILALDSDGSFASARIPAAEGNVQAIASACGATSPGLSGTNYGSARLQFSPDLSIPVGFGRRHFAITSGNPFWALRKVTVADPDWCAGRINTSGKPSLTVDGPPKSHDEASNRICNVQLSADMYVAADPAVTGFAPLKASVDFQKNAPAGAG